MPKEFRVNDDLSWDQTSPVVTILKNKNIVFSWTHGTSSPNIKSKIVNLKGEVVKDGYFVNGRSVGAQKKPSIANLTDGGFIITWESNYNDNDDDYGIFAARFDSRGNKVIDDIHVNNKTYGSQIISSVTGLKDSAFSISWCTEYKEEIYVYYDLVNKVYDKNNIALTNETFTSRVVLKYLSVHSDTLDNGNYLVTSELSGTKNDHIFVQQFYPNGTKTSNTHTDVNTNSADWSYYPDVINLHNNSFLVFWRGYDFRYPSEEYSSGIRGQIFDYNMSKIGSEFTINNYTNNAQIEPAGCSFASGEYVIVWSSYRDDDSSYGVYGQKFFANHTMNGLEFRVNDYIKNSQGNAKISCFADDVFVVTWVTWYQDDNYSEIYAKIYATEPTPTITFSRSASLSDSKSNSLIATDTNSVELSDSDSRSHTSSLGASASITSSLIDTQTQTQTLPLPPLAAAEENNHIAAIAAGSSAAILFLGSIAGVLIYKNCFTPQNNQLPGEINNNAEYHELQNV